MYLYIDKLYKRFVTTDKNKAWVEVPSTCDCRRDKDDIIIAMIEHLELIIKIKK
tara:strand:+ start:2164 stop:2325 length:162 start_codon:yes stop_codon:yes gene_type:complete